MRMRGGVRRFQMGGVNTPVLPGAQGLPGVGGAAPLGGLTGLPGGMGGMPQLTPAQQQAIQQMLLQRIAQGGGGLPQGGATLPGGGMPGGGALMGAGGAGMTPAAMNQIRSAGQAPAVGGVSPILPAGGPGGAAFGPQAAGTPGIGAASVPGVGLNPVAIQQAAAARAASGMARGGRVRAPSGRIHGGGGPGHQPDTQFGVSGTRPPSPKQAAAEDCAPKMARGGKVLVRPSRVAAAARRAKEDEMARGGRVRAPSGRIHGGGGPGHQPDQQFGVSGAKPPSPKKGPAERVAPKALAAGGRMREPSGQVRGGGGPGHQPDEQFGVSGPPAPSPKQAQALMRAGGGRIPRGRGAIVSPEDREQNLNPGLHGARQWGDTMRAAEDLPLAPPPSRRAVIRRRPPTPTPPPYNEGQDVPVPAPGMARGGKWIQGAIKRPGALRRALGVKGGQKIPAGKLAKAAKAPGRLGRQARLAETLRGLNKRKGGACSPSRKKMAAGGVAKLRRGFPNTNPKPGPQPTKRMQRGGTVKVRGAGAAERGTQFKGVF